VVEVIGDTLCQACRTRERAGDEGTRRSCQYRTCEDKDYHEKCVTESDGVGEKVLVNGRCVKVICRYGGVEEVLYMIVIQQVTKKHYKSAYHCGLLDFRTLRINPNSRKKERNTNIHKQQ
jgi:hypothetical protein